MRKSLLNLVCSEVSSKDQTYLPSASDSLHPEYNFNQTFIEQFSVEDALGYTPLASSSYSPTEIPYKDSPF